MLREEPVAAVDTTDTPGAGNNTDGSDVLDLKGTYAMVVFFQAIFSHTSVNPRLKIKVLGIIINMMSLRDKMENSFKVAI